MSGSPIAAKNMTVGQELASDVLRRHNLALGNNERLRSAAVTANGAARATGTGFSVAAADLVGTPITPSDGRLLGLPVESLEEQLRVQGNNLLADQEAVRAAFFAADGGAFSFSLSALTAKKIRGLADLPQGQSDSVYIRLDAHGEDLAEVCRLEQNMAVADLALVVAAMNTANGGVMAGPSATALTAGEIVVLDAPSGASSGGGATPSPTPNPTPPAQAAVAGITITEADPSTVNTGATVTLHARTFLGGAAGGAEVTDRVVTWTIQSGGSFVSLGSATGYAVVVTALGAGSAVVRATCETKIEDTTITVSPPAVANLLLSATSATVASGAQTTFTVTPRDSGNTAVAGRVVTASVTANPANGSVTPTSQTQVSNGAVTFTVTALATSGTATITVACEGITATFTLTCGAVSATFPNEPVGMTQYTLRPFATTTENLWSGGFNANGSIVAYNAAGVPTTGPAAPSSGNVMQVLFPAGFAAGNAPNGQAYKDSPSIRTASPTGVLYCSFRVALSSNFYGHSSGVNKFCYPAWLGGQPRILIIMQGGGSGAMKPLFIVQNMPAGNTWGTDSQFFIPSTGSYTRSTWTRIEATVQINTGDNLDGVIKMWQDGVLVSSKSDLKLTTAAEAKTFTDATQLQFIYGGNGGNTVPADQYAWMDDYYVSFK